jgi:hypothetical protein
MADPCPIEPHICGQKRHGSVNCEISRLAEQQHGVVSRTQLLETGIDRHAIGRRMMRGQLHVIHRGVYASGHRSLTSDGRWMAATLAAGPCAVSSHRAVAAILLLMPSRYLEVTAPTRRSRPGIRIHYASLPPDEITTVRGIPVTTVPRTLLDLAAVLPKHKLERAFHEAEENLLTDPPSLPVLLDRYPGQQGTPAIRALLVAGAEVTRSELEARFRTFIAEFGLQPPELNVWLLVDGSWFECDCLWRRERLVVELDGRAFHGTAAAFERDRARDRRLSAAGWRVIRVTWRQLQLDASEVAADLRSILHRPSL